MNQSTVSDCDPDTEPASSSPADSVADDEPPERPADPAEAASPVVLALTCPDTDPPATDWLPSALNRILALAEVEPAELTLAVVDDARMAQLHAHHCGELGTTDVLTFDLRDSPDEPLVAELVLCRDVAARQAAARGHAARLELLLYAVHGLLHLLGYDDHTEADAAAMHAREDQLLTAAGWGKVYGNSAEY